MIGAFGMAVEPAGEDVEAGRYEIADDRIVGVHLTLLRPDGSGKADVENPKLFIGQGSAGWPICLVPPNDLLGLVVTEGIEEGLTIHAATGLGAWAAGCARRLPALADRVPDWIDCVTVVADPDPAGQAGALALAEALTERGIETLVRGLLLP
jgi:Toprim domain